MSDRIENFTVLFVKRNAAKRGPTSSEVWNDTIDELAADLTEISSQWNTRLVTLLSAIPNGEEGNVLNAIDAWTDGLDGSTLFVDADASATVNTDYFNVSADRPNTIFEQLESLSNQVTLLHDEFTVQIAAVAPDATDVVITDTAGLYTSANVEDALEEVMTTAELALTTAALDQSDISEIATTLTPTAMTQTINFALGEFQTLDLESATGNVTVTLTNPVGGHTYRIKIVQDSTVAKTIVWPAEVLWVTPGADPTISVGANAVDLVTLTWDGTSYFGEIAQNFV